jgi:hypothetical protein
MCASLRLVGCEGKADDVKVRKHRGMKLAVFDLAGLLTSEQILNAVAAFLARTGPEYSRKMYIKML